MQDADLLLEWTDKLKAEIGDLPFNKDDIRLDFFGMVYDAAYNYYRGFIGFKLSQFIKDGQIAFGNQLSEFDKHVKRLMETSMYPMLTKSQMNYLNRHLLIDAWSTFELCTTTFVNAICTDDERDKMLNHHYRDICKNTTKSQISEEDDHKLFSLTNKSHLTHVPITRKTDFLFNKAANYYRDAKQDKEFLIFLGKWRNTMHTNYIYYGKHYEYYYGDVHFIFENEKIVKWYDPFEPSPKLYFYLIGNLKDIWVVLINSIKYDEIIPYPDLEQD
ncbi:MAG: hypothetical protein JWR09_5189 [Mucilaginibacter sp.]|nr:hypothetical protein [Mucilaginibacter sp.]